MGTRDQDPTARIPPESDSSASAEARPVPIEERLKANPERLAEGWERRFVVERARVVDFVRLYESLGFEVITEPVLAEDAIDDCTDCRVLALLEFRMIYTRTNYSKTTRGK